MTFILIQFQVIELDPVSRIIKLNDGAEIKYDSALVATGGM